MAVPQSFVTAAILRVVRRLPGYPDLRVMDLSCGRGETLAPLVRDGCEGRGTHYRPDDYQLTGAAGVVETEGLCIDEGVDLLKPLRYPDASFHVVILSEVVEHLQNYLPVIHEVGRILEPGGHLVLSTPNIARLHSRLHYFWSGTHKLIRRRVGWDIPPDEIYAYHINPVDFPLLHTALHQAGMRVRQLEWTRFKARHAWLFLLYPLVWLVTKRETTGRNFDRVRREGERDLFRWMTHPAMLASEQLLILAQKKHDRD